MSKERIESYDERRETIKAGLERFNFPANWLEVVLVFLSPDDSVNLSEDALTIKIPHNRDAWGDKYSRHSCVYFREGPKISAETFEFEVHPCLGNINHFLKGKMESCVVKEKRSPDSTQRELIMRTRKGSEMRLTKDIVEGVTEDFTIFFEGV